MNTQATFVVTHENSAITILTRLNFGQMSRVQSAALKIKISDDGKNELTMDWPAYQRALLLESVVGWHGDQFAGKPFNKELILDLDPDDPLLQKVLTEIATRNGAKTEDPKSLPPAGGAT